MSITVTILSAGVVVLVLRGGMRGADVDTLRDALHRVLRDRPREVHLDLSGVVDVEPSAAAAVTAAALEAERTGTMVRVVHASPPVRQRMTTAGADGLLR
ncbi:STAS domain-containing protein [Micromonospora sp. NPDC047707]|uniref:STAS domain-containing protein n=1 Tax=unclassified Micromonospora TaxID=2617518 RepID=UPI0012B4921E|nr:STAS domain-containing protein [Micromonospora sp. WMMC415]QGN48691.1 STAS domain-containing protein [Micromonospora sp. WMMC415]